MCAWSTGRSTNLNVIYGAILTFWTKKMRSLKSAPGPGTVSTAPMKVLDASVLLSISHDVIPAVSGVRVLPPDTVVPRILKEVASNTSHFYVVVLSSILSKGERGELRPLFHGYPTIFVGGMEGDETMGGASPLAAQGRYLAPKNKGRALGWIELRLSSAPTNQFVRSNAITENGTVYESGNMALDNMYDPSPGNPVLQALQTARRR